MRTVSGGERVDERANERDEVIEALEQVITWTRRMRRPQGLSASAFTTLDSLAWAGPVRVSDLAAREGLTQPGMTSLVNRLESEGLARRAPDPLDGRAALVSITPEGQQRVQEYRRSRAATLAERIDALPTADRSRLHAALPALRHLIDRPVAAEPVDHGDTSTTTDDTSTTILESSSAR